METQHPYYHKHPTMLGIEAQLGMIQKVQKLIVPNYKFVTDVSELEELQNTLENTFDNADFFSALNLVKKIKASLETLLENVNETLFDANLRVCETCKGSGTTNGGSNNPYAEDCLNCSGRGIL